MAIVLGSNIAALQAQRRLAGSTRTLEQTSERLASGQRINRASDDAAGLAIADALRADTRILTQGVRNLNDGVSLLSVADAALEGLTTIVTRLEELATQAASGTYGGKQRTALDSEAQALTKEYNRIIQSTDFNGRKLLNSSFGNLTLQAGVGTNATLSSNLGGVVGTGTFTAGSSTTIGWDVHDPVFADFNNDGFMDFANATPNGGALFVSLGRGDGTFASAVSYVEGNAAQPISVTAADFNNDSIFDIVTGNRNTGTLSVYLGRGDGTFASERTVSIGSNSNGVRSADFNGDGKADIISSDGVSTYSVLLGRGDGTFQTASTINMAASVVLTSFSDLNSDGALDLVLSSVSGASYVQVYMGRGDGTFAAGQTLSNFSAGTVAFGDFNGDGKQDFISAEAGSNYFGAFLGDGTGRFTFTALNLTGGTGPTSLNTADFNGDGILDLQLADRTSSDIRIFLGRGDATFTAGQTFSVPVGDLINSAIADLNNDGVLDILTNDRSAGVMSVFLGNTTQGTAGLLPFSLKTSAEARQAIPILKRTQDQLLLQRSKIGAFQSRISVATSAAQSAAEQYQTAESRIRDIDVAEEAATLVRTKILQKAAVSVLAQANIQPALALDLLNNAAKKER